MSLQIHCCCYSNSNALDTTLYDYIYILRYVTTDMYVNCTFARVDRHVGISLYAYIYMINYLNHKSSES